MQSLTETSTSPISEGEDLSLAALVAHDEGEVFAFSAQGGEGKHHITDFDVQIDTLQLNDVLDINNDSVFGTEDVPVAVDFKGPNVELTISGDSGNTIVTLHDVADHFAGADSLQGLIDAGLKVDFNDSGTV